MTERSAMWWLAVLGIVMTFADPCPAADKEKDKATEQRVNELLDVIGHAEANPNPKSVDAATAARAELTEMGEAAVPYLVDAVATRDPSSQPGWVPGQILLKLGKPALPAIKAKWDNLNDERRWRFMPILEMHDPESVSEFARTCLDAKDEGVRALAWGFVLRAKDPKVKDRYFKILDGKREEADRIRRSLTPGHEPYFDEERENNILIDLLAADSWAAKGKGAPIPPSAPPPWGADNRPMVIRILRERKVKDHEKLRPC